MRSFNGALSKFTIALESPTTKSSGWRGDFKLTLFICKFNSWTRRICPAFRITFGLFFFLGWLEQGMRSSVLHFSVLRLFLFKKNQEGSKNNQSLYRAKMNGQKSVCEQSVNLRALRNVFPSSFGFSIKPSSSNGIRYCGISSTAYTSNIHRSPAALFSVVFDAFSILKHRKLSAFTFTSPSSTSNVINPIFHQMNPPALRFHTIASSRDIGADQNTSFGFSTIQKANIEKIENSLVKENLIASDVTSVADG